MARGFERVAATVYGYLDDDDDSDFSEDPVSRSSQQRTSEEKKEESRSRTETMDEMFEQFFDAIDDLSDSELGNSCGTGLGLVIPKLRNDSEIAAHYNVPLQAINQLKAGEIGSKNLTGRLERVWLKMLLFRPTSQSVRPQNWLASSRGRVFLEIPRRPRSSSVPTLSGDGASPSGQRRPTTYPTRSDSTALPGTARACFCCCPVASMWTSNRMPTASNWFGTWTRRLRDGS